jgi:hypothetical protein
MAYTLKDDDDYGFSVGPSGGLLWKWYWMFCCHKIRGISWLAEQVLASQEEPWSMELVCVSVVVNLDI